MTATISFLTITLIVLPQWLLMIAKPQSKWTQKLVDSDIIPFLLLLVYVVCITQNESITLEQISLDCFPQLIHQDLVGISIWAYTGFLSLVIGGWLFNKAQELKIQQTWAIPSLLILLMLSPMFIFLSLTF